MSDEIVRELAVLRNKSGTLDPMMVVNFARTHETSALHARFNWNVKEAAMEHWLLTARQLIRVHYTVLDTGHGTKEPVRMFVSPRAEPESGKQRGYIPTVEVLADPDRRRDLILSQIERLWSVYKSYPLAELDTIGRAIERCRKQYSAVAQLEAAE